MDQATEAAARSYFEAISLRRDVVGAVVFGRVRRESFPDSDANLAVLLRGAPRSPGSQIAEILLMSEAAHDVRRETGIRIQPLPIWELEWGQPEAFGNADLVALVETVRSYGVWL